MIEISTPAIRDAIDVFRHGGSVVKVSIAEFKVEVIF